jgi:hypothetical protein
MLLCYMTIIKNKEERRYLSARTSICGSNVCMSAIIALALLVGGGFIFNNPATMFYAFAQESNNDNATNAATITDNNSTITTAPSASSPYPIELSPNPVYQEYAQLVSQNPINETFVYLTTTGNGILILPNTTETMMTTNSREVLASLATGSAQGKITVTTEDETENATITFHEIARFGEEESKGIVIAIVHTNSTGRLAPLHEMILAGTNEISPEGTATTTLWEWQIGIDDDVGVVVPTQEQMLDLNFSEFSEFDDSSQLDDFSFSSFFTEINGTYMNPNIGFQIDLPTGWKGIEINFLINSVLAAPAEINLLELEGTEDFQEPATLVTIVGIDEGTFSMIEGFSEFSISEEGAVDQEETFFQSPDPLDPSTIPFGDETLTCAYLQPSFVTINDINAEERVTECISESEAGISPKMKSYVFATQDNSLIAVGFYGNSTNTYDQNLTLFEESVRTINISQPADIATSEIYNRYKELLESQLPN